MPDAWHELALPAEEALCPCNIFELHPSMPSPWKELAFPMLSLSFFCSQCPQSPAPSAVWQLAREAGACAPILVPLVTENGPGLGGACTVQEADAQLHWQRICKLAGQCQLL
ncbi:transmembrane 9 superfamily member 4 [Platysternon megacephalum]|uniref:Transmembrane 9 superfamily member 4 n=1 Tax=Platysternon megacephalum TaxID=55544 RepID=A0A4D9E9M0_9SAUR|nr:transmembrane 9 superfamily member 4 [Platysternon megacephalum]